MTVHRCDFPLVQAWAQHVQKLVQGSGSIRKQCVFDSPLHFRSVNSDARWLRGSGLLLRGVRVTLAELQGSVPAKGLPFCEATMKAGRSLRSMEAWNCHSMPEPPFLVETCWDTQGANKLRTVPISVFVGLSILSSRLRDAMTCHDIRSRTSGSPTA